MRSYRHQETQFRLKKTDGYPYRCCPARHATQTNFSHTYTDSCRRGKRFLLTQHLADRLDRLIRSIRRYAAATDTLYEFRIAQEDCITNLQNVFRLQRFFHGVYAATAV